MANGLRSITTTAYIHPPIRKRMDRVAKADPRLTLSKQLSEGIENGITIAQFEKRVGIRK